MYGLGAVFQMMVLLISLVAMILWGLIIWELKKKGERMIFLILGIFVIIVITSIKYRHIGGN